MTAPTYQPLPLGSTLAASFRVTRQHLGALLRLVWPTVVVLAAVRFAFDWYVWVPEPVRAAREFFDELPILAVQSLAGCVIGAPAVAAWCRGLQGLGPLDRIEAPAWRRSIPVGFYLIAMSLCLALGLIAIVYAIVGELRLGRFIIGWLGILVAFLGSARLGLFVPARAAGPQTEPADLWEYTAQMRGWRVAFGSLATLLPVVVFAVAQAAVSSSLDADARVLYAATEAIGDALMFPIGFWNLAFFTLAFQHFAGQGVPSVVGRAEDGNVST